MNRFIPKSLVTVLALLAVGCLVLSVLHGCGGSGSPSGQSVRTRAPGGVPGKPDKPPEEPEPPPDPAIAFVSGGELWVMNDDGSNRTKVVADAGVRSASWSPDGGRLVFANYDATAFQGEGLYVVSIAVAGDGLEVGAPELLVPAPAPSGFECPAWSPLGDRIAYGWCDDVHDMSAYGEIRAISPDGGTPETLYEFSAPFSPLGGITWSTQAGRLAVAVFNGDYLPDYSGVTSFIGVLELATGTLTDVTSPGGFVVVGSEDTDWARGSDRIAFCGRREGEELGLWILDLPSLSFQKLFDGTVQGWGLYEPSWSPDDTRLVVSNTKDLWLLDVATGDLTLLAKRQKGQGGLRAPDWRRF